MKCVERQGAEPSTNIGAHFIPPDTLRWCTLPYILPFAAGRYKKMKAPRMDFLRDLDKRSTSAIEFKTALYAPSTSIS